MFRRLKINKLKLSNELMSKESFNQSIQSYVGVLSHCNGYKMKKEIENIINK